MFYARWCLTNSKQIENGYGKRITVNGCKTDSPAMSLPKKVYDYKGKHKNRREYKVSI
jgi:hypothetical protein